MNCTSESKSDSCDEPLFVLKYRRGKVIWRLLAFLPVLCIFGYGINALKDPHGLKEMFLLVGGVLSLFIYGLAFIDILFFEAVRVYSDRVVKIWKFIGERQIRFVDAQLRGAAGNLKYVIYKTIFHKQTNVIFSYILGVSYDEMLANPDDIQKLNTLLAALTARKVEEFEQPSVRIRKLIERETK
jgi:hypothetical protein